MPAQRQFTVSGIFEVGADIDQQLVLLHGADLARLLRYPENHVTGLRLWLNDAFESAQVSQRFSAAICCAGLSCRGLATTLWPAFRRRTDGKGHDDDHARINYCGRCI